MHEIPSHVFLCIRSPSGDRAALVCILELGTDYRSITALPTSMALLTMPSVMSETASIFGELLLADLILAETASDEERKAILCLVLDEVGMIIF